MNRRPPREPIMVAAVCALFAILSLGEIAVLLWAVMP